MPRMKSPQLLSILFILMSTQLSATSDVSNNKSKVYGSENESTHPHHERSNGRMGVHGMALFTDGVKLYASHMPLYHFPHDYQLIYEVESTHQPALIAYLTTNSLNTHKEAPLLSIVPEVFDLNLLINGESLGVSATLFKGHFEREGTEWLIDQNLFFKKQLFKQRLEKKDESGSKHWSQVVLNGQSLYIHSINNAPSFDALVWGKACPHLDHNKSSIDVPSKMQIRAMFSTCSSHQIAYYETQDFVR